LWENKLREIYFTNLNATDGYFYDVNQYTVLTQAEIAYNTLGNDSPSEKYQPCPDLPEPKNSRNPAPSFWDWRDHGVQTAVTVQVLPFLHNVPAGVAPKYCKCFHGFKGARGYASATNRIWFTMGARLKKVIV
jgi:hypothetical protein